MDLDTVVVFGAGSVEYSIDEAVVEIDELIAALEEAKEMGATHAVASSGNYRGPGYSSLSTHFELASDRED